MLSSQNFKTTFKQDPTCIKKAQKQFSFVQFVLDDPVCTKYWMQVSKNEFAWRKFYNYLNQT